ncbi:hypothetical protein MAA5396_01641 [Marinovum algicola]|uniref:N-terminal double-transmembrane domain-containing protein n=1 Tax=Marinovum algicola TaxID=42444 RepID=A0A975W9W7_9RHOB|nr:DUF4159 domain-containing protein [Marinovum algicola]SEJ45637.1 N-terminal double-transmembrane domain-containing protein [Marinovum algicola]SLN35824.1 hypothetical protein MAA5396_01641 [Marinovum algicola]
MTLFGIGFLSPWLLLGLLALPILWIILRAVPPAPIRRMFPAVVLLLGLKDDDQVTDRTPWWLLLLRILAVAAVILGLAGPILNPREAGERGSGPLLIAMDASWASAGDWAAQQEALEALLLEAQRDGRTVAMLRVSDPEPLQFQAAETWRSRLPGLAPEPWLPGQDLYAEAEAALDDGAFDTLWLSDGLAHDGRADFLAALESRGAVRVVQSARPLVVMAPPGFADGAIELTLWRVETAGSYAAHIAAHGRDPSGNAAVLARAGAEFADGAAEAQVSLSLPAELRGRITHFEVEGQRSAGAVALSDDSLRRREVALIAGRDDREGLELLSPLHYLEKALEPNADLLQGALGDILPANPDVVVLADVATLAPAEEEALLAWVEKGGLLLRFAGPRLAASDVSRAEEDALMPVRLRAGGRTVGGAMSWGEPKALAPFAEDSPFAGLPVPEDVRVSAQVMAQPDPVLADRVIAQLADGTPLVTRKRIDQGQVVLVHVTANAEWSTLPLSGLFVQMLDRLAVSSSATTPDAESLEGTTWEPLQVMDAFGALEDAGTRPGVDWPELVAARLGPDLLPGLYQSEDRRLARNVITAETELAAASWPARIPVEGLSRPRETPLAGLLLSLALALLAVDVVASLALAGRLTGGMRTAAVVLLALGASPPPAAAQSTDDFALAVTSEVVLGHVLTGDPQLDQMAYEGLTGLSETLFFRTSVEPAEPIGVDLETDELAFFPFLYWPVAADQPIPSDEAYAKLNEYLRSGGMILFDTRDADIAGFGAASPNGQRLQRLAQPLDIPPLEPVPEDHVLTRTFYLLQDFPGRHVGRDVWVEAAPPDAERIEGMPFRNLNDGVTPVVIGGNDWAAAWAMDESGNPIYPVGRGYSGERQRELAYRFGVNLIMHVLTGNYKSDQVHVPALLDRLGQ